jgi:hypothetical protein
VWRRIYDDRLDVFVGGTHLLTLPLGRAHPSGKHDQVVDYRHVIHSLRRKPMALLGLVYRDRLFPREAYRRTFDSLHERLPARAACRLMLDLLALAMSAAARPNSPISSRPTWTPADCPTSSGCGPTSPPILPACRTSWCSWLRSPPMSTSSAPARSETPHEHGPLSQPTLTLSRRAGATMLAMTLIMLAIGAITVGTIVALFELQAARLRRRQ